MPRNGVDNRDRDERREDALRPCRRLGYDRDELGMHLVEYGAAEIAESQFRRAIWLNPFEPRFKVHLAWCLYKEARRAEALAYLAEAPDVEMDAEMKTIIRLIEQGVSRKPVEEGR